MVSESCFACRKLTAEFEHLSSNTQEGARPGLGRGRIGLRLVAREHQEPWGWASLWNCARQAGLCTRAGCPRRGAGHQARLLPSPEGGSWGWGTARWDNRRGGGRAWGHPANAKTAKVKRRVCASLLGCRDKPAQMPSLRHHHVVTLPSGGQKPEMGSLGLTPRSGQSCDPSGGPAPPGLQGPPARAGSQLFIHLRSVRVPPTLGA